MQHHAVQHRAEVVMKKLTILCKHLSIQGMLCVLPSVLPRKIQVSFIYLFILKNCPFIYIKRRRWNLEGNTRPTTKGTI